MPCAVRETPKAIIIISASRLDNASNGVLGLPLPIPDEVIDRVHDIAKYSLEGLYFRDQNNNPIPEIPQHIANGPYESDDDSAIILNDDDDDTASSNSRSSGPDNKDNASNIAGVRESEEEDDDLETPGVDFEQGLETPGVDSNTDDEPIDGEPPPTS